MVFLYCSCFPADFKQDEVLRFLLAKLRAGGLSVSLYLGAFFPEEAETDQGASMDEEHLWELREGGQNLSPGVWRAKEKTYLVPAVLRW